MKDITITGAHLVGSAPVKSAEAMFRMVSENLGSHVKRIGDGEIGERDTWILFQNDRLGSSPQLEAAPVAPFKKLIMWFMSRSAYTTGCRDLFY